MHGSLEKEQDNIEQFANPTGNVNVVSFYTINFLQLDNGQFERCEQKWTMLI